MRTDYARLLFWSGEIDMSDQAILLASYGTSSAVMAETGAEGVGVVIRAKNLCMMMRGVEKQNSEMTTSAVLGSFRSDEKVRQEFLNLAR